MSESISKKTVLLTISSASFLSPFMISAINIALPAIQKAFQVDAVTLSWIVTSYILATAVFLVPAGKLADIYGRKKLFILGIIIFALASLFCAFAPSIEWFILIRIFQGLGGSIMMTTGVAILTSVFPVQQRGKVLGLNVSMVYIGLAAGPTIGGLLTSGIGWKSIFFLAAPIAAVTVILALLCLKGEWADARGEKLDLPGSIIYAVAIVAITYGFTLLPESRGVIYLLLGILAMVAFVKRQLRISYPVFEMRLFKNNRVFTFSNIAAFINYAATSGVIFLMSLYLQYIKGMSPHAAGLMLIVQPIVQTLLSPYAGKLSDQKEPGIIASMGMASTALGLFLLIFIQQTSSLYYIIAALVILGVGVSLFGSPNTNAIMSSVPRQYYGIASGAVSTMRLLGQNFSMALTTLMITLVVGKAQLTPATYGLFLQSAKISFVIFTLLCLGGIYFSYSRGNIHPSEASPTGQPD